MEKRIQKLRKNQTCCIVGGGERKIAGNMKRELTARERINMLLDPGSFCEFNMLIRHKIGAPGDGIVIGHGTIDDRVVCVFAQDTTVFGGSQGYYHGRNYTKFMKLALDMGVPLIGLNDSPGARVIRPEIAGSDDPYV